MFLHLITRRAASAMRLPMSGGSGTRFYSQGVTIPMVVPSRPCRSFSSLRDLSSSKHHLSSVAGPASPGSFSSSKKLRIVIIGQDQFGAAVYRRLKRDGHEIVGVFTQPNPGNRADALAVAAQADSVPVFQPKSWRSQGKIKEELFEKYKLLNPDLNVLAFVNQIIPQPVLQYPTHTSICFHPSLLPKRRGRSAINHAIINGDRQIGLTVFWPDEGLDTGPVLTQRARSLGANDTVMTIYQDFLFPEGVNALSESVHLICSGLAPRLDQNHRAASYEAPWEGDIAVINWNAEPETIHNLIRGSDPTPGALTTINGHKVRLYGSRIITKANLARLNKLGHCEVGEGKIQALVTNDGIVVPIKDSFLRIETLRFDSGKAIKAREILKHSTEPEAKRVLDAETLELKSRMAAMFAETIGCAPELVNDAANFFDLGGGSMEAAQLVGNLIDEFGLEGLLEDDAIILHPTLEDMFEHVLRLKEGGAVAPKPPFAPDQACVRLFIHNKHYRTPTMMLIDGHWCPAVHGKLHDNVNPATEEVLCKLYEGTMEDVDLAVDAARRALKGPWGEMSPRTRGNLLLKLADVIEKNEDELAYLECVDSGIPLTLAKKTHIGMAKQVFRYYGGWADKLHGQTIPIPNPGPNMRYLSYTRHEPVGVVGAIVPWNFPAMMVSWKLGPALACGNTVVLKPAFETSLTALKIGEYLQHQCGLPAGVLNIVTGGIEVGSHMVHHTGIDKLGFTGSTQIGKLVLKNSTLSMKRITLELGGKSPLVIFKDCDLQAAIKGAYSAAFFNMGQNCIAGARVFVEDAIHDEFVEGVVRLCQKTVIGDPLSRKTDQGPQNSLRHLERILSYCRTAEAEGCKLVYGGHRRGDKGFFMAPTVFTECADHHTIVKEEIFGPVMSVLRHDGNVERLIERCNDTNYGLAGGVYTSNIKKGLQIVNGVRAGSMWINTYNTTDTALPFGGFKESGLGRELGEKALEAYTELKTITIAY